MTASIPLFQRKCKVVVGGLEITNLDLTFSVSKDLTPKPNKAEIKIWNMTEAHRSAIEQMKDVPCLIEAGYEAGTSNIFLGDLRSSYSAIDGPDIVTTLSSGDGEKATQKARINVSIKKNTPTTDILKLAAKALGVGEGNLKTAASQIQAAGLGTIFTAGTVLSGSAVREMSNVCKAVGLTWSVQDGKLQILPIAKALDGEAIKISSATGMVGTPSVDTKGVLKVNTLMIPDVFPGRKLVLDAARLKGQYRIEKTTHKGDTSIGSDQWGIEIEAKKY